MSPDSSPARPQTSETIVDSGTVAAASGWDEPMQIKTVQPSLPESYEHACHETGVAAFLLPLRDASADLRSALRQMRSAVDEYKRYSDMGLIPVDLGTEGYPTELELLVEGVDVVGQVDKKLKLLRRIPVDPMTGEAEWGLRSYQDDADSTSWGGE